MRWDDAAHSEVVRRTEAQHAECVAHLRVRRIVYPVHYLFYKIAFNFHSPQDLKMCVNTVFDFDMAASRGNKL